MQAWYVFYPHVFFGETFRAFLLTTVVCILFYLWVFLFSDSRADDISGCPLHNYSHAGAEEPAGARADNDASTERRWERGWMWHAIHFPLLFCILLFLAGLVVSKESVPPLTAERC